jgi:NDP-sugar pyrophosphorylase family protein
MKSRITITISPKILEDIDKLVDGEMTINRSNAIEKILREHFRPSSTKAALILAGGQGIRLRPITYELPKSMITIKGKPILEYIINKLKEAEVTDVVISIGYLGERVKEYFGDGSKFGVNIKYMEEAKPLGTGGAIKQAQNIFKDDTLVINGDQLFDFDLSKIYNFHKKQRALITVAVTNREDISKFGAVEMDGDKIVSFIEKPATNQPTHLINAGIYVLNPLVFSLLPEGQSAFPDFLTRMSQRGRLNGFLYSGKWFPCDNLQLYEKAIKGWN